MLTYPKRSKVPSAVSTALRERTIIAPFDILKDRIETNDANDPLMKSLARLSEKSLVISRRHPSVTEMLMRRAVISLLGSGNVSPVDWMARHKDGKQIDLAADNLKCRCAVILNQYRHLKKRYGHHLAEFVAGYPDADALANKISRRQEKLKAQGYRKSVALLASFSDTPSIDADKLEHIVSEKKLGSKSDSEIFSKLFDICLNTSSA